MQRCEANVCSFSQFSWNGDSNRPTHLK